MRSISVGAGRRRAPSRRNRIRPTRAGEQRACAPRARPGRAQGPVTITRRTAAAAAPQWSVGAPAARRGLPSPVQDLARLYRARPWTPAGTGTRGVARASFEGHQL